MSDLPPIRPRRQEVTMSTSGKRVPRCRLCGDITGKRAKVLVVEHPSGGRYSCLTKERVWCSLRCAAAHALLNFNDEETIHWCPVSGEWVFSSEADCTDCEAVNVGIIDEEN
jgi:hypothetical protein